MGPQAFRMISDDVKSSLTPPLIWNTAIKFMFDQDFINSLLAIKIRLVLCKFLKKILLINMCLHLLILLESACTNLSKIANLLMTWLFVVFSNLHLRLIHVKSNDFRRILWQLVLSYLSMYEVDCNMCYH